MDKNKLRQIGYQVSGADTHVKSRESRIAQAPKTDVVWSGEIGASKCYPQDIESQQLLEQYGQTYIKYNRTGEPDFSKCSEASVKISDMSSDRQKNFSSAGRKLLETEWAKKNNIFTLTELDEYRKQHRLTWHERSDGVTLDLVPTDINSRFGHSGGVSELAAMKVPLDVKSDGLLRTGGKIIGTASINMRQNAVLVTDNAGSFADGAINSVADSAIPLTIEATNQFMLVVQGEQSIGGAAKEVGQATLDTAVKGGTNKLVVDVTTAQFAKSNNVLLKDIAKNNQVAELIVAAKIVSDSAIRYINNEIDGERFIDEVKENAAMMVAGKIGSEVGAVAGAAVGTALGNMLLPVVGGKIGAKLGDAAGRVVGGMVATMAVGMICSTINEIKGSYKSIGRQEQAYLDMLDAIYEEATAEMNRQREMLKAEFEKKQIQWTTAVEQGFDTMIRGACEDSFDEVTEGLDRILELFNTEARFHNANEVRNFLNTSDRVFVL